MLFRQGDLLIQSCGADAVDRSKPLKRLVLARGDATGHCHEIKDRRTARVYAGRTPQGPGHWIEVVADEARISHPEHGPIVLPRGAYVVWRQREFAGGTVWTVND